MFLKIFCKLPRFLSLDELEDALQHQPSFKPPIRSTKDCLARECGRPARQPTREGEGWSVVAEVPAVLASLCCPPNDVPPIFGLFVRQCLSLQTDSSEMCFTVRSTLT